MNKYTFIIIAILLITTMFSNTAILALGGPFDYTQVPTGETNQELENVTNKVWNTFAKIIQVASFAGVIFAGLRYMLSSADKKADMKKSMIALVMGIAIVFASTTIIDIIVKIFMQATT